MPGGGSKTPVERYPEMDWRAVDKVAEWRIFRKKMTIIFIADGVPMEQQYAKVLVAGGNEAFLRWQTIEPLMEKDKKDPAKDIRCLLGLLREELQTDSLTLALQGSVSFRFQARAR